MPGIMLCDDTLEETHMSTGGLVITGLWKELSGRPRKAEVLSLKVYSGWV